MKPGGQLFLILIMCFLPESKKFGPFDVLLIVDESASMLFLKTTNTPNGGDKHYKKSLDFVVDNFNIGMGENQSRIAVLCTLRKYITFNFYQSFNETVVKGLLMCQASSGTCVKSICFENLHDNFVRASTIIKRWSRQNVEKVVIVFTDGVLYQNETKFPESAENVRNDGKFFFFHLIEPQQLTPDNKSAMINLTQNDEHVIYFDVQDISKVKDQFLKAICKSDKNVTCEVVHGDPFNKCHRKLSGLGYETCMENQVLDCVETACECDQLYPWITSSCSVTCGEGQQTLNREVQNDSLCPKEETKTCFIHCSTNDATKRMKPLVRTVSIHRRSNMVSVRVSPCMNLLPFIISVFIIKLLFY